MNSTKVFGQYVIAFDGIGKFTREWEWYENCLKKHKHGQPEGVNQYYAYALESSIVLANGLTIPLMTEFLDRSEYDIDDNTTDEKRKQDSELKAFKRLAKGLKEAFPRLKIAVTLDGLYANGPLMEICKDYEWDFMIILKDGSLKSVWENIEGIKRKNAEEIYEDKVINRKQQNFWWINGIEYTYGNNNNKSIKINVVICEETWQR